jgi:hypothetical protein
MGAPKLYRYWVSWFELSPDYRPLTDPPSLSILGWWCSGESEEGWSLVAWVEAVDDVAAKQAVRENWPPENEGGPTWRFCHPRADVPSGRFPLSDWMRIRAGLT